MTESALDKVLRLAGGPADETSGPDLRELIGAARSELREAVRTGDPMVAAQLVYAALTDIDAASEQLYVELSGPVPDLALAVLSTAERKKPGAHTIPGSTDFPIPDEGHLQAALARYKQGALAGHSKEEVAGHIRARAKALGVSVDLSTTQYGVPVLLELARGKAAVMDMAVCSSEHHPPMHGTHVHAHTHTNDSSHGSWMAMMGAPARTPPPVNLEGVAHGSVTGTHSHAHTHVGDNMHGGRSDTAVGTQMDAHQRHMAHVAHMEHLHAEHVRHVEHMAHQSTMRTGRSGAAPSGAGAGGQAAYPTGTGQAMGTTTAAGRGTGWG